MERFAGFLYAVWRPFGFPFNSFAVELFSMAEEQNPTLVRKISMARGFLHVLIRQEMLAVGQKKARLWKGTYLFRRRAAL